MDTHIFKVGMPQFEFRCKSTDVVFHRKLLSKHVTRKGDGGGVRSIVLSVRNNIETVHVTRDELCTVHAVMQPLQPYAYSVSVCRLQSDVRAPDGTTRYVYELDEWGYFSTTLSLTKEGFSFQKSKGLPLLPSRVPESDPDPEGDLNLDDAEALLRKRTDAYNGTGMLPCNASYTLAVHAVARMQSKYVSTFCKLEGQLLQRRLSFAPPSMIMRTLKELFPGELRYMRKLRDPHELWVGLPMELLMTTRSWHWALTPYCRLLDGVLYAHPVLFLDAILAKAEWHNKHDIVQAGWNGKQLIERLSLGADRAFLRVLVGVKKAPPAKHHNVDLQALADIEDLHRAAPSCMRALGANAFDVDVSGHLQYEDRKVYHTFALGCGISSYKLIEALTPKAQLVGQQQNDHTYVRTTVVAAVNSTAKYMKKRDADDNHPAYRCKGLMQLGRCPFWTRPWQEYETQKGYAFSKCNFDQAQRAKVHTSELDNWPAGAGPIQIAQHQQKVLKSHKA